MRPSDVVIVLGNLMDAKGKLNDESASRVELAASALKSNQVKTLLACGWAYREDSPITIASAMKRHAVDYLNISSELIVLEENSRDTVGDAFFSKINHVEPLGLKNILVSTSSYHAKRTLDIFSFIYGRDYSIEVIHPDDGLNSPEFEETEKKSTLAFQSTFDGVEPGNNKEIYEALRARHPYYNGTIYNQVNLENSKSFLSRVV